MQIKTLIKTIASFFLAYIVALCLAYALELLGWWGALYVYSRVLGVDIDTSDVLITQWLSHYQVFNILFVVIWPIVTYWLMKKFRCPVWERKASPSGFTRRYVFTGIAYGTGYGLCFLIILFFLILFFQQILGMSSQQILGTSLLSDINIFSKGRYTFPVLFLMYVLWPISQGFLFWKLFYPSIRFSLNPITCIILTGFLSAIFTTNPVACVFMIIGGVITSYLFERSQNMATVFSFVLSMNLFPALLQIYFFLALA